VRKTHNSVTNRERRLAQKHTGIADERGGKALHSSASRNGPFGLRQVESFRNSFLARIVHERFCCNRQSAAATRLRPVGSPLRLSPYCTRTLRVLRAPRAGLTTQLSDVAANRHEQCGLDSPVFDFLPATVAMGPRYSGELRSRLCHPAMQICDE